MTIKLFTHQEEDLRLLQECTFFGLWHQVGSGKSYPTAFRIVQSLMQNPEGMWVILLEPQLADQWEEYLTAVGETLGFVPTVAFISGSTRQNRKDYIKAIPPQVLMTNYEYFPSIADWLMIKAQLGFLVGMVADEAHRLKGFRGHRSKHGKRAKLINLVAHARLGSRDDIIRIALSGSPLVNPESPDAWGLYHFLHPEVFGKSRWKFEQEFFYDLATGQPYSKLKIKPNMKEEFSRRFYSCARRLLTSELDVEFPKERWITYRVDMSPKLAKFYKDLCEDALATLDDGRQVTRIDALSRFMALQQVASGMLLDGGDNAILGMLEDALPPDAVIPEKKPELLRIDTSHKDRALASIIEEIGVGTQCIIWAHFRHELEHIVDFLVNTFNVPVACVWGAYSRREKDEAIRAFKAGGRRIMVAQPASAGAGLDLWMAGHSIRWSRSPRLVDFEQSIGRIKRAGHVEHPTVTYHEIVTKNSSDMMCFENLRNRRNLAGELTLDHIRELRS